MAETSGLITVSTKLERIAKLAREMPQAALTTLAHHIDIDWLREAYRRTRKDGATGVDRQTANEYANNLEENLRSLLERAKSAFDTAVWPTNDAYIWPTTLLCIVQSFYESIAPYSVVLVSFFPVA